MTSFSELKKERNKASLKAGIPVNNPPPTFFVDSGGYVLNKILTGSYDKGWGQGRLGCIAGPSGSGKSFLMGNAIKAAQDQGCAIFIIDSENALDEDYLEAIGVDVHAENFMYRSVITIEQATSEFSAFTKAYRDHKLTDKVFVAVDSLDMLMTTSQAENYAKGETKGDQGQHVKQLKDMLKGWVQDVKTLPFVVVCTKQVYKEQDRIAALSEPYVFTESVKFAFSQILMITKLMLKADDVDGAKKGEKADKNASKYAGIWLKAKGFKTRFTKPFQQVKIQVPYDEGMDAYSGILDVATSVGILTQSGSWYDFNGNSFQKGGFKGYREEILRNLIAKADVRIDVEIEEKDAPPEESISAKMKAKIGGMMDKDESEED